MMYRERSPVRFRGEKCWARSALHLEARCWRLLAYRVLRLGRRLPHRNVPKGKSPAMGSAARRGTLVVLTERAAARGTLVASESAAARDFSVVTESAAATGRVVVPEPAATRLVVPESAAARG